MKKESKVKELTISIILILLIMASSLSLWHISLLEQRMEVLEKSLARKTNSTVEILVERAFDEDMRLWGYKLKSIKQQGGEEQCTAKD